MKTILESDSIGALEIPADAYYGVQSLRGQQNFHITGRRMEPEMINNLAKLKKAAAITNCQAGLLDRRIADAIVRASDDVIAGNLHEHFIVDPIQGGAGTSANMNANEVIANRAQELLGGPLGDYSIVHPNDHVNMSQSTNDVFPTAGKMTVLELIPRVIAQLEHLHNTLESKSVEFDGVIKMGRTQLQDAVPIRLGQSFHAWAGAIARDISRIQNVSDEVRVVNMGGTAIGTAINVSSVFLKRITANISEVSGIQLIPAHDLIDATQNLDGFVAVSGILKTCAVNLSKMANDMRLLSSGPKTGMGEINLPPMQNGSSIMPGKVNPVIPEVVSQVAFSVMGNDFTISMAAEAGQLELNAFEPVLFYKLFESLKTLEGAIATFTDNCISGITANEARCKELLEQSVGTVTALCPYTGYKTAASIAKESLKTGISVRKLVLDGGYLGEDALNEILNPMKMTIPGTFVMEEETFEPLGKGW